MKAFIFAAGFGTRMRDLTSARPKPLLVLGGFPLLAYNLFVLSLWQVEGLIINTHYRGNMIRKYLKTFPYFPINFSEEKKILETAGGLNNALSSGLLNLDDKIIALNSDLIFLPRLEDSPTINPLDQLKQSNAALFLAKADSRNKMTKLYFRTKQDKISGIQTMAEPFRSIQFSSNKELSNREAKSRENYYYIGYSLLSLIGPSKLAVDQSEKLTNLWREDDKNNLLIGKVFKGQHWSVGDIESYQKLSPNFDLVFSNSLKKIGLATKWDNFIAGWPQAQN